MKLSSGEEFDKKVGEWIEEDVEVDVVRPLIDEKNPEHKTFIRQKEKFTQKTMYIDAPKRKVMCSEADHEFEPTRDSKGNNIPNHFICTKCQFKVTAYPHKARYNPITKKLEPRGWK